MEQTSLEVIYEIKKIINQKTYSIQHLQDYWQDLQNMEFEVNPDWSFVFQKIYIHACLKGQAETANWLKTLFEEKSDPIQKIAYRQTYSYGKYLLQKHKPV